MLLILLPVSSFIHITGKQWLWFPSEKAPLGSDAPLIEPVCTEIILTSLLISCNDMKRYLTSLKSCLYCPSAVTNVFHPFIKVLYMKAEVHVEMRQKAQVPLHLNQFSSYRQHYEALWTALGEPFSALAHQCQPFMCSYLANSTWGMLDLNTLLTSLRSSVIFLIAVAQVVASFSVETQLTCVLLVHLWPGVWKEPCSAIAL